MAFADEFAAQLQRILQPMFPKILDHQHEREPAFLKNLGLADALDLARGVSVPALFGYPVAEPDYQPRSRVPVVIEFKRIGLKDHLGVERNNEYDIVGGLSQILIQALGRNATEAILVLLDAGRASARPWNEVERAFVGMFKANPFGVSLSVIRVVVDRDSQELRVERE